MIAAYVVFVLSLAGLVGLFTLKEREVRTGRVVLPSVRAKLDQWALYLADVTTALKADAEKLPPELLLLSRHMLHDIALALAGFLRFLSQQAHRLAETVSHKRNFVRRAPRSEFLKKVGERKNGTKPDIDTFE